MNEVWNFHASGASREQIAVWMDLPLEVIDEILDDPLGYQRRHGVRYVHKPMMTSDIPTPDEIAERAAAIRKANMRTMETREPPAERDTYMPRHCAGVQQVRRGY
jgi:hypothetical protein